jgi:hypothetical protein
MDFKLDPTTSDTTDTTSQAFSKADDTQGNLRSIVPFLDLANHSFAVPQCHLYEQSTGAVKIIAGKPYTKNQEIFINYGPVSNTKLARLYGFVVPQNPHDAYDLILSTHPQAPFFTEKASIFSNVGLDINNITIPLTARDPLPTKVLQYLRIQRLSWTEINLAQMAGSQSGTTKFTSRNESEVLVSLKDAFESLLSNYRHPISDLQHRISNNSTYKICTPAYMAAVVSVSEQQILGAALGKVKQLLDLVVCAGCGKVEEEGMKRCARCLAVVYCGVECQRGHWGVHKLGCVKKA